jgi:adenylylsulfate kinase
MMGKTIWLFGPSGAGKTTIGEALVKTLEVEGKTVISLDGDVLRAGLCSDLGFEYEDRYVQATRAAHIARILNDAELCVVVALITPHKEARAAVRGILKNVDFIYLSCSKEERMNRDPKGLYAKAVRGEIKGLTGYDGAFDDPTEAAITVNTDNHNIHDCVSTIIDNCFGGCYKAGSGI